MTKALLALVLTGAGLFAQPVVNAAVNAASYARPGLPNGGLAQSSYISIFGQRLGPQGGAMSQYPLPTTLGGVSAKVGATDLFIVYASPTQINAIIPGTTPLGNHQLVVTVNGQAAAPISVQVVARSFGLFSLNQAGSGPALSFKYISQGNEPVSTLVEALNPGGTLTFYGTGAGAGASPDNIPSTDPAIPGLNLASDVEILVGGKRASIAYFGRPNWGSAIDQIVATLPADTPTGCYVPMIVRVGGVTSNSTSVSVAPQGQSVCSDPNGFSQAELEAAKGRGVRQGFLSMVKIETEMNFLGQSIAQKSEALNGTFTAYTFDEMIRASSMGRAAYTNGTCSVYTFDGEQAEQVDPITGRQLDAGPALSAQNSNGTQSLTKLAGSIGFYNKLIMTSSLPFPGAPPAEPEFLTTGNHTYTGPGGADVGAFTASLNWPAAFAWTNQAAITSVNRGAGVIVNWTGGDPAGSVQITGFSGVYRGNDAIGAGFVCIEDASKGTFTVPAAITSALPVSSVVEGVPLGQLSVTGTTLKPFDAPNLDIAYISYTAGAAKMLGYN